MEGSPRGRAPPRDPRARGRGAAFRAGHRFSCARGRNAAAGHVASRASGGPEPPPACSAPPPPGARRLLVSPPRSPRDPESLADSASEESAFLIGLERERRRALPETRSLIGFSKNSRARNKEAFRHWAIVWISFCLLRRVKKPLGNLRHES